MANNVDIVFPNTGESVTDGKIIRWTVPNGAAVTRDQPVVEIETDKITVEVPAPAAGKVTQTASAGQKVQVGQLLGRIEEGATGSGAPPVPAPPPPAPPPPATPPPATPAAAGSVRAGSPARASNGHASASTSNDADVRVTPLARKVADELGVDLARVTGTGAGGRIREQDVVAAAQARSGVSGAGGGQGGGHGGGATTGTAAPSAASVAPSIASGTKLTTGAGRGVRREKLPSIRLRIAERLVQAQHAAAMLTTFNEVDMTAVMDLRKRYKDDFEKKHAIGLGFMSFFVKAAVNALRRYPAVNAYMVQSPAGEIELEHHDYYDVAVAVSTPKGLTVPVIRDCDKLSFAGIESAIKDLAGRARDGKLALSDLQGGTFTITNGGVFGSLLSTPILNAPQTAILGMHTIKNRPVEHPDKPGEIALRPMMYLALSYDHRVIDGSEAVGFLVSIKNAIERPERLLLDM